MQSTVFLALTSFLCCLALTPLVRDWSNRYRLLDRPDGARKVHVAAVPRTGGIAILLSCIAAFGLASVSSFGPLMDLPLALRALPAVLVVFGTGLLDDFHGLTPSRKLAGQTIAAVLAYAAGIEVLGVAGVSAEGWWRLPLTTLWLVGCANAFNLIDGVDGLSAGIGVVAAGTILLAAGLENNLPLALATAPLLGALVAFLRFNLNPASIFLGDSGSLTVGFVLGCYGAVWSQKSNTLMGMTAPVMALAVPLCDTALAILRRYLRHQPIFLSDRNHIHHRLLARGFTPRDVAFALSLVGTLAAAFALFQSATHSRFGGIVVVLFGGIAWLGVRSLGYLEFQTARYLAASGVFRRILDAHVDLRAVEARLAQAATPADYWAIVRDASNTFGFSSVEMRLQGRRFQEGPRAGSHDLSCSVRIPLQEGAYVEFSYPPEWSVQRALALSALANSLQRSLSHHSRQQPAFEQDAVPRLASSA